MNIFKNKKTSAPQSEHAVIVRFEYGKTDLQPLFALEDELLQAVSSTKVGEYDGHEIATDGSNGVIYMYGPDGNKLLEVVKPLISSAMWLTNGSIVVRYGVANSGAKEKLINLHSLRTP